MAQDSKTHSQSIVEQLTGPHPPHTAAPFAATTDVVPTVIIGVAGAAARSSGMHVTDVDPTEVPKTLDELNAAVTRSYDLSVTRAGELNIPVLGSVGGGYNRRVVVLERAAYKTVTGHSGAEYHLGYAIRLCLTVNKWEANMKVSLPFLAASAQMGQVEAGWMLQVLGLTGTKLAQVAAPPSELNVETFVTAKQSLVALIEAVNDSTTTFTAYQIAKLESAENRDEDLRRGVAKAYALSRIARRSTLQDALNRIGSGDATINDSIRDTYEQLAPGGAADKPSEEAARKSRDLLGRVEADV